MSLKELPKQPEVGGWAEWNYWAIMAIEIIDDNTKTIFEFIKNKEFNKDKEND